MQQFILSLAILMVLFSCANNSNSNPVVEDRVANVQMKETIAPVNSRQLIIEELKKLKTVLASKNESEIQKIFTFPLADTLVEFYIDDASFNNEMTDNNGLVSHQMFLHYFTYIYQALRIDELNNLFGFLTIDSLERKDQLSFEIKNEIQPCCRFYSIGIAGDTVTLHIRVYTNTELLDKLKEGDDDNVVGDECAEFSATWLFKFDGQKFLFTRRVTAG